MPVSDFLPLLFGLWSWNNGCRPIPGRCNCGGNWWRRYEQVELLGMSWQFKILTYNILSSLLKKFGTNEYLTEKHYICRTDIFGFWLKDFTRSKGTVWKVKNRSPHKAMESWKRHAIQHFWHPTSNGLERITTHRDPIRRFRVFLSYGVSETSRFAKSTPCRTLVNHSRIPSILF